MLNNIKRFFSRRQKEAFFQFGTSNVYTGLNPKIQSGNFQSMVESYETWIYAAVSCIARNVARCNLHLYQATGQQPKYQEVENHPFWDLWRKVNPEMNAFDLLEITQIFLDLTGNAYWYIVLNKLNKPVEIYPLPTQRVKILLSESGSKQRISGYRLTAGSGNIDFTIDEILHFKYPNPLNEFYGLSPLQAMIYAVGENDLAHQFGYNVLRNQAVPGNIFTAEEWVDTEMLKLAKEEIKTEYEGVKRAGKTMILKGIKPTKVGLSPMEINFLEGRKFLMEEILAIYGVPKTKIGMGDLVNRAVADALDYTFQKETILPRLKRIENKINEKLLPLWDKSLIVEFESPVPEDREFELKQWEMWLKNYVRSINEYREYLGIKSASWGNKPLAPFSIMPLSGTSGSQEQPVKRIALNKQVGQKWYAWVKIEENIEQNYIRDLKSFFESQKKIVLANVKRVYGDKSINKKNLIEFVFPPVNNEAKRLTEISYKHFVNAMRAGIHFAAETITGKSVNKSFEDDLGAIGMTLDSFDVFVEETLKRWQDLYGITINNTMKNELRDILAQSVQEGWGVTQLQEAIIDLYSRYDTGITPERALRIARTEVSRIMNETELDVYVDTGYEYKTWSTALDEFTCEECSALEGEVVGVNETFSGGVQCPPLHPNCRCVILAGKWR